MAKQGPDGGKNTPSHKHPDRGFLLAALLCQHRHYVFLLQNMELAIERHKPIEQLDIATTDLAAHSEHFQKSAHEVKMKRYPFTA